MPKEFSRTKRIGEMILRELSLFIQQKIEDPRLGFVTISDVKVSPDLAYAKVFCTVFGEAKDIEESIFALNKSAGFLRTLLAKSLKMRVTPQLRFIYDDTTVESDRLSRLIDAALADNKLNQKEFCHNDENYNS